MRATKPHTLRTASQTSGPRWRWLAIGVVAALLVAAAGGLGWWLGSSGDTTEPMAVEVPEIVERWAEALLSGDGATYSAVYTEKGVNTSSGGEHREKTYADSTTAPMADMWFSYITLIEVKPIRVFADGDTVFVEWEWSGTSSTLERGGADQTSFSASAFTAFELEGTLIARSDTYFDYEQVFN